MQPSEIEELQELKKELDGETVDINALEGIDAKDPYKLDPILRSPPPRKRKENDADTQIDNADVILSGIGVNAAQQSAAAELSDQELRELFSAPAGRILVIKSISHTIKYE